MFKIVLGCSHERDPAQAVGTVIAHAMSGLADARAQAGILLNSGHKSDSTLLRAIHETWPSINLIGCAGPGHNDQPSLSLLLLNSPDLVFHVTSGALNQTPQAAAEHALSTFMDQAHNLALYLSLHDQSQPWPEDFVHAATRLLPEQCACLEPLLPPVEKPWQMDRYYQGREVTNNRLPLLLASNRVNDASGWRFTRQPGIVRKQHGEAVYEYDRLIGDRRRRQPAA